jgi:hypothetical protein
MSVGDLKGTAYFPRPYPVHYVRVEHKFYRVTYAYSVVGMTSRKNGEDPTGDPAFRVRVACAFCNTQDDEFTKLEGRNEVQKAWMEGATFEADVYIGQGVLETVEKALGGWTSAQMQKLHVPSKLVSYYHSLVPKPKPSSEELEAAMERRRERNARSRQSRVLFRLSQKNGLSEEAAQEAVRVQMVQFDQQESERR